jgi:Family of unknown function (DUF5329)
VKIRRTKTSALALALGLVLAPAAGAAPSASVLREIDHLLRHIGTSGCEFKRNGDWNDAKAAEAHARGKYDFLATLGRIDTTKDFIDKVATGSSLSGQPYEIRCGGAVPVPSSLWLNDELARYRASRR